MDNDGYDSDHVSVLDVVAVPNDTDGEENSAASLLTSSDEENDAQASNRGGTATATIRNTFDSALPLRHTYLGEDLEELNGRTLLEEGSTVLLPLLPQTGLVLVPGQTFPLSVSYPHSVQMLRDAIATNRTFGVVCVRWVDRAPPTIAVPQGDSEPVMSEVGTTAEIFAYSETDAPEPTLLIKSTGRQRFRLVDMVRQTSGQFLAKVLILPEVLLPDLLRGVGPSSWLRHCAARDSPCAAREDSPRAAGGDSPCAAGDPPRRRARQEAMALRQAAMTTWPLWVHRLYDPRRLVARMKTVLKHLEADDSFHIPSDPAELSYWVCQTLPLPDEQRVRLLSVDCAVQRLHMELETLENYQVICCAGCKRQVADKRDVFSMSAEGPQGTYINPGGYIHEIMTLHHARGLVIQTAQPSFEYSWFQGYGWTIVECGMCGKHMGWLFTTTQQKLHPKSFFGLCRRSLVIKTTLKLAAEAVQLFA